MYLCIKENVGWVARRFIPNNPWVSPDLEACRLLGEEDPAQLDVWFSSAQKLFESFWFIRILAKAFSAFTLLTLQKGKFFALFVYFLTFYCQFFCSFIYISSSSFPFSLPLFRDCHSESQFSISHCSLYLTLWLQLPACPSSLFIYMCIYIYINIYIYIYIFNIILLFFI